MVYLGTSSTHNTIAQEFSKLGLEVGAGREMKRIDDVRVYVSRYAFVALFFTAVVVFASMEFRLSGPMLH